MTYARADPDKGECCNQRCMGAARCGATYENNPCKRAWHASALLSGGEHLSCKGKRVRRCHSGHCVRRRTLWDWANTVGANTVEAGTVGAGTVGAGTVGVGLGEP